MCAVAARLGFSRGETDPLDKGQILGDLPAPIMKKGLHWRGGIAQRPPSPLLNLVQPHHFAALRCKGI